MFRITQINNFMWTQIDNDYLNKRFKMRAVNIKHYQFYLKYISFFFLFIYILFNKENLINFITPQVPTDPHKKLEI